MNSKKNGIFLVLTVICLFVIQTLAAKISSLIASLFNYTYFDPDDLFLSFSWFQVAYAFILGIAYGITYIKSKSIIYPMIMHSMSNVIMVGIGYLLYSVM